MADNYKNFYKNFQHVASNGDQYLVEHRPEVKGGFNPHPILPVNQEYLPPRDVVKLEAVNGRSPEKGTVGLVYRGVTEGSVLGVAFHAATGEVIGMHFAKPKYGKRHPDYEQNKDVMFGYERRYGSLSREGHKPTQTVPDDIRLALEAARNAWRNEIG